jgi:hypothetical protein
MIGWFVKVFLSSDKAMGVVWTIVLNLFILCTIIYHKKYPGYEGFIIEKEEKIYSNQEVLTHRLKVKTLSGEVIKVDAGLIRWAVQYVGDYVRKEKGFGKKPVFIPDRDPTSVKKRWGITDEKEVVKRIWLEQKLLERLQKKHGYEPPKFIIHPFPRPKPRSKPEGQKPSTSPYRGKGIKAPETNLPQHRVEKIDPELLRKLKEWQEKQGNPPRLP